MSLQHYLPWGLWIMYSRAVQGIALKTGVRLVTVKPATRQLYTRHRGTAFKWFCCKNVEASKVEISHGRKTASLDSATKQRFLP